MFGELVGVWVFAELGFTGYKDEWQLVELGPGTGTLMKDILGAMKQFKVRTLSVIIQFLRANFRSPRRASTWWRSRTL